MGIVHVQSPRQFGSDKWLELRMGFKLRLEAEREKESRYASHDSLEGCQ